MDEGGGENLAQYENEELGMSILPEYADAEISARKSAEQLTKKAYATLNEAEKGKRDERIRAWLDFRKILDEQIAGYKGNEGVDLRAKMRAAYFDVLGGDHGTARSEKEKWDRIKATGNFDTDEKFRESAQKFADVAGGKIEFAKAADGNAYLTDIFDRQIQKQIPWDMRRYVKKYGPETLKKEDFDESGRVSRQALVKIGEALKNKSDVKFSAEYGTAINKLNKAGDLRDLYRAALDLYQVARRAGVTDNAANKIFTYGLEGRVMGYGNNTRLLALARVSNIAGNAPDAEIKMSATAAAEIKKAGTFEEINAALVNWEIKRTALYEKLKEATPTVATTNNTAETAATTEAPPAAMVAATAPTTAAADITLAAKPNQPVKAPERRERTDIDRFILTEKYLNSKGRTVDSMLTAIGKKKDNMTQTNVADAIRGFQTTLWETMTAERKKFNVRGGFVDGIFGKKTEGAMEAVATRVGGEWAQKYAALTGKQAVPETAVAAPTMPAQADQAVKPGAPAEQLEKTPEEPALTLQKIYQEFAKALVGEHVTINAKDAKFIGADDKLLFTSDVGERVKITGYDSNKNKIIIVAPGDQLAVAPTTGVFLDPKFVDFNENHAQTILKNKLGNERKNELMIAIGNIKEKAKRAAAENTYAEAA